MEVFGAKTSGWWINGGYPYVKKSGTRVPWRGGSTNLHGTRSPPRRYAIPGAAPAPDCPEAGGMGPRSKLLLEMNPVYKKIPVFIHNGRPVAESLIILQYIDEAWPSSKGNLLPSEPYDRAIARFWADFVDKKFYDTGAQIIKTKGEAQEEAKRQLVEHLVLLEGAFKKISGGKPYFGGETFGFLDIAFIPFTSWFLSYESIGNFKIPLEEKCPNINAWIQRCKERESVKKVFPHPEKVLEFSIELRKRFVTA